jgi:hypothetical protein
MTKTWASIALLLLSLTTKAQHTCHSKAHIGFCYPISTHGVYARDYSNVFSLHALVGVSAAEEAFCVSGFSNIVYGDTRGLTAAGFSNHIGSYSRGIVAAGFLNTVKRQTKGLQAAGFANISGSVHGAQLAGFANISKGNITGVQGSGFLNIARNVKGVQWAGYFNKARNVKGAQLAGYVNIADTVNTQVSGFLNIAKTAKVQLSGFINIADSCDYPIGIINIIKKGEKSLGLSYDINNTTMLTFRSGGRVLYGIVGLGYNSNIRYNNLFTLEAGVGAHITLSKLARFNIEGTTSTFTDFTNEIFMTSSLRILPALTFGKHLEIFAGPCINSVQSDDFSGEHISKSYLWSNKDWGMFNGLYVSAYGGINYRF